MALTDKELALIPGFIESVEEELRQYESDLVFLLPRVKNPTGSKHFMKIKAQYEETLRAYKLITGERWETQKRRLPETPAPTTTA